jgi:hypothetical protein
MIGVTKQWGTPIPSTAAKLATRTATHIADKFHHISCSRMQNTIWSKGLMIGVTKQWGTPIPSTAAKLAARTATHIADKFHHRSTIHHLWYKICSEKYENMRKMMGCPHQEFRVWWWEEMHQWRPVTTMWYGGMSGSHCRWSGRPPWHQGKPPRPVQQQSSGDVPLQLLAQVPRCYTCIQHLQIMSISIVMHSLTLHEIMI